MTSAIGLKSNLMIEEKKKYPKFFYILIFLFIYISDDTLLFGTNDNSSFVDFKYMFVMAAAVLLTVVNIFMKRELDKKTVIFFVFLVMLIFLSMAVNNDVRLGYFYKICLLLYGLAIVQIIPFKDFAAVFNKIMSFLAIASLIGYVVMLFAPGLSRMLPVIENTNQFGFYNAFVTVIPDFYTSFSDVPRNFGVFREPGVYQMFLIIAIIFQTCVLKENNAKRYVIYVISILTTLSTTGFVALGIVFLIILFSKEQISSTNRRMLIFFFLAAFIILFATTDIFSTDIDNYNSGSIFYKIFNPQKSESGAARFASVTENIRIALEKPLFGVGITDLGEKFTKYATYRYNILVEDNTNTFLVQFAAHGFIYGFMWIWGYWQFAKAINRKNRFLVFIAIVIIYIGENLTFSGFASLFLLYGIASTHLTEPSSADDLNIQDSKQLNELANIKIKKE